MGSCPPPPKLRALLRGCGRKTARQHYPSARRPRARWASSVRWKWDGTPRVLPLSTFPPLGVQRMLFWGSQGSTHTDVWLAFSSVKCEVSPRGFFGEKKGASVSSSHHKYTQRMSGCRMEDLVLRMDSATQKHLSPLLIILISWNSNGKCNNSCSSLKKYPGIQRRVILHSSRWIIRIVSCPSKIHGLSHTMFTFKLSATEQLILCNSLSWHFKAFTLQTRGLKTRFQ